MRHMDHHLESVCEDHVNATTSSIIQKPLTAPLSSVEEKMASHLKVILFLLSCNEAG